MSSYLTLPKDLVSNCFSYLSTTEKFFRPLYSSTTKSAPKKMDLSMIAAEYGRCTWIKVAALAGCTAVLMGAYGAHGLKNISNERRQVFETANKYHFYHALAMLAVPFLKRYHLVGALFSSGIMVFCGTCYCNAITGNESVIRYTPIGGWMFIIGWLAMLF